MTKERRTEEQKMKTLMGTAETAIMNERNKKKTHTERE